MSAAVVRIYIFKNKQTNKNKRYSLFILNSGLTGDPSYAFVKSSDPICDATRNTSMSRPSGFCPPLKCRRDDRDPFTDS